MSIAITTWLRAYFALQQRAIETSGFTELITEDEAVVRTPRTVGQDVIAIASVIDPYVRAQPENFGVYAFGRRWQACIEDLEVALVTPRREYAENQSFWESLQHICVYLHAQYAALPPAEIWESLLYDLGSELRNAGPKGDGPFKHFDVNGFDELYTAQFNYLRQLRGADDKDAEAGMGGSRRPIPRSTNADVIALADYWTKQLATMKKIFGHDAIAARWRQTLGDVEGARKADPNAAYPKNNGFWRELAEVAVHVAVADDAPTKADIAFESVKNSIVHLPQNIVSGTKTIANEVEDIVGSAAHAIGSIANSAGKGLFAGFGTPLIVGAGLVGLFLISRAGRHEIRES